jgi:hypothetical protein
MRRLLPTHVTCHVPVFKRRFLAVAALSAAPLQALAELPTGWINSDFVSAYTQDARTIDISAEAIKVNDTLDVLNIREDLLAGTNRLSDDSGDLSGFRGTVHVGLLDTLSAFYTRQEQDMTLKLGTVSSSINIVDIDEELTTEREEYGLKWTIYQAGFLDSGGASTAGSIELSRLRNSSDDFNLTFDRIDVTTGSTPGSVYFAQNQTAGIQKLEDEGWNLRFIYTTPLSTAITASAWAGYSEVEATSGTGTTIPLASINAALTQRFDIEETWHRFGANLNWQLSARIPLQLSYEYIHISKQDLVITAGPPVVGLPVPSILQSSNLSSEDGNHTLTAALTWWATPAINVGVTAHVYSNQFLGVIPHFNNPLTASFGDDPYGYVGLRVGIRLP